MAHASEYFAETREMEKVSLFASRSADAATLTLVLVNRDQTLKVAARIALQDCGSVASSRRFTYGQDSQSLEPQPSELGENTVSASLEPFSFSVLELKLGKASAP